MKFYFLSMHIRRLVVSGVAVQILLVMIVFPVFLLVLLSHLMYLKLSVLESFRFAFINSVFFFFSFAVILF